MEWPTLFLFVRAGKKIFLEKDGDGNSFHRRFSPALSSQRTTMRLLYTFKRIFHDEPASVRYSVIGIYAILVVANLAAWAWALIAFHSHPVLLGTDFLAYGFGLRHAVDADHIAAIDNVIRKLMQQGKRPVAVGLVFSLGHSTIVIAGSIAIAATALALQNRMDAVRAIGGVIGTSVSALFLFGIAIVNLIVLQSVYRSFVRVRRGEPYVRSEEH